jgi:uncharacterized membrane protein YukC
VAQDEGLSAEDRQQRLAELDAQLEELNQRLEAVEASESEGTDAAMVSQ